MGGQKQRLSARARRKPTASQGKVWTQKSGGGQGHGLEASRLTNGSKSAAAAARHAAEEEQEDACDDACADGGQPASRKHVLGKRRRSKLEKEQRDHEAAVAKQCTGCEWLCNRSTQPVGRYRATSYCTDTYIYLHTPQPMFLSVLELGTELTMHV